MYNDFKSKVIIIILHITWKILQYASMLPEAINTTYHWIFYDKENLWGPREHTQCYPLNRPKLCKTSKNCALHK